jgi:hypothetical protein
LQSQTQIGTGNLILYSTSTITKTTEGVRQRVEIPIIESPTFSAQNLTITTSALRHAVSDLDEPVTANTIVPNVDLLLAKLTPNQDAEDGANTSSNIMPSGNATYAANAGGEGGVQLNEEPHATNAPESSMPTTRSSENIYEIEMSKMVTRKASNSATDLKLDDHTRYSYNQAKSAIKFNEGRNSVDRNVLRNSHHIAVATPGGDKRDSVRMAGCFYEGHSMSPTRSSPRLSNLGQSNHLSQVPSLQILSDGSPYAKQIKRESVQRPSQLKSPTKLEFGKPKNSIIAEHKATVFTNLIRKSTSISKSIGSIPKGLGLMGSNTNLTPFNKKLSSLMLNMKPSGVANDPTQESPLNFRLPVSQAIMDYDFEKSLIASMEMIKFENDMQMRATVMKDREEHTSNASLDDFAPFVKSGSLINLSNMELKDLQMVVKNKTSQDNVNGSKPNVNLCIKARAYVPSDGMIDLTTDNPEDGVLNSSISPHFVADAALTDKAHNNQHSLASSNSKESVAEPTSDATKPLEPVHEELTTNVTENKPAVTDKTEATEVSLKVVIEPTPPENWTSHSIGSPISAKVTFKSGDFLTSTISPGTLPSEQRRKYSNKGMKLKKCAVM